MTRNSNPTRIQDNNESPSTINNPSLDPNPISIQDVIRNPCPIRIEDSFDL